MVKKIFFLFIFLLVIILVKFVWSLTHTDRRLGVVLVNSTISIFSFENSRGGRLIILPRSGIIESTRGYGNYSLEGLWKLGFIEKKDGQLLTESLEEALSIPLKHYLGAKELDEKKVNVESLDDLKAIFNIANLPRFLGSGWKNNLNLSYFVTLSNLLSSMPPNGIQVLDYRNSKIFTQTNLPDGSTNNVFDPSVFDHEIKTEFEEEAFRSSGLTVAIYNTTETPLLGNRAARMLSHLGVRVVLVANDTPKIEKCELKTSKSHLQKELTLFIKKQFDCKVMESEESGRANLILRLGSAYEGKFSKNK